MEGNRGRSYRTYLGENVGYLPAGHLGVGNNLARHVIFYLAHPVGTHHVVVGSVSMASMGFLLMPLMMRKSTWVL